MPPTVQPPGAQGCTLSLCAQNSISPQGLSGVGVHMQSAKGGVAL